MKSITIIVVMLFISCYTTNAQIKNDDIKTNYAVIAAEIGYMTQVNKLSASLPEIGYKFSGFYASFKPIIRMSADKSIPFIASFNLGYGNGLQAFISGSYQSTGIEAHYSLHEQGIETHNGWKFGYGLNYYLPENLKMPLRVSVEQQGKYTITGISIYQAL